jgi:uncharacterized protein (TIGR02444 family)
MTFWKFSLHFYRDAEVQVTCLALQDKYGADVNLLLYLLWRAGAGDAFDLNAIERLNASVEPWRSAAIAPLRAMRRTLKGKILPDTEAQQNFQNKVKVMELEAERLEQEYLESLSVKPIVQCEPLRAAIVNLNTYADFLNADIPTSLIQPLLTRLETLQ